MFPKRDGARSQIALLRPHFYGSSTAKSVHVTALDEIHGEEIISGAIEVRSNVLVATIGKGGWTFNATGTVLKPSLLRWIQSRIPYPRGGRNEEILGKGQHHEQVEKRWASKTVHAGSHSGPVAVYTTAEGILEQCRLCLEVAVVSRESSFQTQENG
ncbi:hypothetical protein IW262DRAFT_1303086 [Armillaria fumosa]|nr:hypothetical protein IW262DRAFT_1303086 [Armillaria fumosa]